MSKSKEENLPKRPEGSSRPQKVCTNAGRPGCNVSRLKAQNANDSEADSHTPIALAHLELSVL